MLDMGNVTTGRVMGNMKEMVSNDLRPDDKGVLPFLTNPAYISFHPPMSILYLQVPQYSCINKVVTS